MARKSKNLQEKDKIVIFCEGYTEVHYFNMLKRKYRGGNVHVEPHKSKRTNAYGVVHSAINSPHISGAKKVYAIFDKDRNTIQELTNALNAANQNGIDVGYSNISFDLWVLMHFEKVDSYKTQPNIIQKLNKHFKCTSYEDDMKNNAKIGDYLSDKVNNAISNSLDSPHLNQTGNLINFLSKNPFHNIHNVVEDIFKISKFKGRYN
ncbi:RloB family protein [Lysinibacillus capsici]|uniref:RloB family protein n=1 Tax=Lysinibacillus TaxID=400634 RepID=UPI002E1E123C|nr:RloB family protein [Lysinibacillus capsici]